MKGDFSRNTFDKNKHYTSVRMQQGRVQLDADWNEQMDILDNRIRVGSMDFIGGSGAPSGEPGYAITLPYTLFLLSNDKPLTQYQNNTNVVHLIYVNDSKQKTITLYKVAAKSSTLTTLVITSAEKTAATNVFTNNKLVKGTITNANNAINSGAVVKANVDKLNAVITKGTHIPKTDFNIGKGRFYVQGTLIENVNDFTYSSQSLPDEDTLAKQSQYGLYLMYLDVWQQSVSAIEDKTIQEPALNGADTTVRIKNRAQVKLVALENSNLYTGTDLNCNKVITEDTTNQKIWNDIIQARTASTAGKLSAEVNSNANLKNQLYRIEIHKGGDRNEATFKWSRNNGALSAKIENISGNNITINSINNNALNFKAGQWIELTTEKRTLQNKSGIFVQLNKIDTNTLSIVNWPSGTTATSAANEFKNAILRQWDVNDISITTANTQKFFPVSSPKLTNGKIEITLNANNKPNNIKVGSFIELKTTTSLTGKLYSRVVSINSNIVTINNVAGLSDINVISSIRVVTASTISTNINGFITLENGLQIKFAQGTYKTGDYWLIPTRAETNNIASVQYNFKTPQLPEGIIHHYAQLALVRKKSDNTWEIAGDCRNLISALGNQAYQSAPKAPSSSVFVAQTGNVEIKKGDLQVGTSIANKNLTVEGSSKTKSLQVTGATTLQAGATITGGNVIIGSSTASKNLTVNGKTTTETLAIKTSLSNYVISANKPTWLQQKLEANDKAAADYFGYSVAMNGDYLIVGAYSKNGKSGSTTLFGSGAAYIYKRTGSNTWSTPYKLELSDKAAYDYFGFSVAINGNYAIVGTYGKDGKRGSTTLYDSGAVYIYKRTGDNIWSTTPHKLEASDKAAGDNFGYSVAISGDYAIVGAYGKAGKNGSTTLSSAGAAYIYKRTGDNTWSTTPHKLELSDKAAFDYFGFSVAINGDYVIIGAYTKNGKSGSTTLYDSGAAYIYKRTGDNTWSTTPYKLEASDKAAADYFGYSVAMNGDYLIVGAYSKNGKSGSTTFYSSGAAYIYKRTGSNTWSTPYKLELSDKAAYDYFGFSVAINGNYAIVGAYDKNGKNGSTTLYGSGAAYIYKRTSDNTWGTPQKLEASDKVIYDYFGHSVAMNGNYAIVGAYGKNGKNSSTITTDSGAVYSYLLQNTLMISPQNSNDKLGIKCGVAVGTDYATTYAAPNNGLIVEGNVGIGSNAPTHPLTVNHLGTSQSRNGYGFLRNNSSATGYDASSGTPVSFNESAYFAAGIWINSGEVRVGSDKRIKDIVAKSETEQDLQLLNQLTVTDFRYKDKILCGMNIKKGLIAQEVEKVCPTAVQQRQQFIPNIYQVSIAIEMDSETKTAVIKLTNAHGLAVDNKIRLLNDKQEFIKTIIAIPDEKSFVIDDWHESDTEIFVYGKEVDDFRTLDYNQVLCLHISATQNLYQKIKLQDEQIQSLNKKIDLLSAKIESL